MNSFDLPDDVFEAGDVRPARPKKKVIKKTELTAAQKRPADAIDVSAGSVSLLFALMLEPAERRKRSRLCVQLETHANIASFVRPGIFTRDSETTSDIEWDGNPCVNDASSRYERSRATT